MDICFVNPTEQLRSTTYNLSKRLVERGHEVSIIWPYKKRYYKEENKKITYLPLSCYFLHKNVKYTFPNLKQEYYYIRKLLSHDKIDVLHMMSYPYLTTFMPILLKNWIKKKMVITIDSFPGISWFFGLPLTDIAAKIYTLTLGKITFKNSDNIVLLSKKLINDAIRCGIPKNKLSVIPNGVDTEKFKPGDAKHIRREFKIDENDIIILFIGRYSNVKGIEFLMKIAYNIQKLNKNVKFLIVGKGFLDSLSKEIKFPENCILTGFREDVPDIINASDIVISTSISEGLSNTILEGSACGKPCVATRTGAVSDIIIDSKTGFIVDYGDIDTFVQRIVNLINDTQLRKKIGKAARRHVKMNFNWEKIIDSYEKLYSKE